MGVPADGPGMGGFRFGADFECDGDQLAGWLYLPVRREPRPVVVMAHGFGAERTWRLPEIARRFASRGLAVFVFDYRGFGESDGEPRRVIDPGMQVDDWQAAIRHVRSHDRVADRVALWGTSFSGGHVIEAAASESVDAVVSQVPFLDGRATVLNLARRAGVGWLARAMGHGLLDSILGIAGRTHRVPVAADPGEFALIPTPDAKPGYESLIPAEEYLDPEDEPPEVRAAARIGLTIPFYRPVTAAADVDCPAFVAQATEDAIVPPGPVDTLVARLPDVERVRYEMGHFDAYREPWIDAIVGRQADFLVRHLRPGDKSADDRDFETTPVPRSD